MYRKVITTSLLALVALAEMEAQPRLVVSVVIDQLRPDLLEAYADVYGEGGFKRLIAEGRVWRHTEMPFANVDRASAMACLMTGAKPEANGIPSATWIDRETLQTVTPGSQGWSLEASTIADELKLATAGRALVYAIGAQKDALALAAAHSADGAHLTATNEETTARATNIIQSTALGLDHTPDLLTVTYSATATTGDAMDAYMNLDWQLSQLMTTAEERTGKGGTLFLVTGTGYDASTPSPDELTRYHIPTGEFSITRACALLNMYLTATFRTKEDMVDAVHGSEIYLNHRLAEKMSVERADLLAKCADFLSRLSGVRSVETRTAPHRQGDLVVRVNPGWTLTNENTGQRTLCRDGYFSCPTILMGEGIEAIQLSTPITADRLAPTICEAIRIRAPNACDARPL